MFGASNMASISVRAAMKPLPVGNPVDFDWLSLAKLASRAGSCCGAGYKVASRREMGIGCELVVIWVETKDDSGFGMLSSSGMSSTVTRV